MKKTLIYLIFLPLLFQFYEVKAQVTIGSGSAPKYFSILEVDAANTKGGLRLPQIQQSDRDTISISGNTTTAPGLTIYNTDSKSLEYWDGSNWVKAAETEPWMVSGGTTKATQNNQNIYQMGRVGVGINNPSNPFHVFAASDPMRVEGLQSGTTTDSIVTANTTGVVKRRSIHSLRQDIVAAPVGAEVPFKGMFKFDTATNTMQYYNGTAWVSATETEPWMVTGTTTKASLNTQDIFQTGKVGLGINVPTNQLHVKTASDPLRLEGLQSGVTADSLVTANATGVVKRRSVRSLRQDVVAAPVGAEVAFKGMLKFDTATNTMQYYDGSAWQIIASNALFTKNEGVVRVNSGGAGSVTSFGSSSNHTTPNQWYTVTYTSPFTYGIAAWPENITNPTDASIYNFTLNRFIENSIVNQTHIWRVTLSYTKDNNVYSQQIDVSLYNPVSGFRTSSVGTIASGRTSGTMTLYLVTVADANSIGTGYQLQWSCSDDLSKLTIDNVTRISNYKD